METRATFRQWGPGDARADAVTDLLGLSPSQAVEVGERASPRGPVRSEPAWMLSSAPESELGVELSEQLARLLDLLEPRADKLWRLIDEGWEANWFCYLGSHATEHAAELDRELLRRLLALPGDLWLDVYPDDDEASDDDRAVADEIAWNMGLEGRNLTQHDHDQLLHRVTADRVQREEGPSPTSRG